MNDNTKFPIDLMYYTKNQRKALLYHISSVILFGRLLLRGENTKVLETSSGKRTNWPDCAAVSFASIKNLECLKTFGYPILLATSRKSVIGLTLDLPTEQRVEGTIVTTVME